MVETKIDFAWKTTLFSHFSVFALTRLTSTGVATRVAKVESRAKSSRAIFRQSKSSSRDLNSTRLDWKSRSCRTLVVKTFWKENKSSLLTRMLSFEDYWRTFFLFFPNSKIRSLSQLRKFVKLKCLIQLSKISTSLWLVVFLLLFFLFHSNFI